MKVGFKDANLQKFTTTAFIEFLFFLIFTFLLLSAVDNTSVSSGVIKEIKFLEWRCAP